VGLALCSCATDQPGAAENLNPETELAPFVDEMVAKHGFDRSELADVMGAAKVQKSVLEAIARPAESLNWHQYRPIFVTADRISQGAEFWQSHGALLERAEKEYGVPSEIIVAILGVETHYGRHKGRYRVLDSLATLSFRYPKRSGFFRGELEQYLLLTREEGLDPKVLKGSYAGAMGIPQFISSSYRRYAVDFDDDQVRDLLNSRADAIGSVANYLKVHGWRRGARVALPATVAGDEYKSLLVKGPKPSTRLGGMADYGVVVLDVGDGDARGALIELSNKSDQEHWVVLGNFYAITRYNHSNLYAMAVFQLAREIRSHYTRLATR
jgi:membrane-bound lytic murein transglycosylase B